jgi:hypothetical protein
MTPFKKKPVKWDGNTEDGRYFGKMALNSTF